MAKKNNKEIIIWAVVGIIIVALLFQPGGITNTSTNIQNLFSQSSGGSSSSSSANLGNPNTDFVSARLYDANGNLITTPNTYAIVNSISGVASMDYTIALTNTGGRDLTCTLGSPGGITPTPFSPASTCSLTGGATMSQTLTQTVKTGQRVSWTSNKMAVPGSGACALDTLSQPIALTATISCNYVNPDTSLTVDAGTHSGTMSLTIGLNSGVANFTVGVNTGGIPTEFCGDNICQSPMENINNCIHDCSIIPNTALRTSDLSYPSGSAIAYNGGVCSAILNLTRYGYVANSIQCSGLTGTYCPAMTGYSILINKTNGLPGCPTWAATAGVCSTTNYECLYQNTATPSTLMVAFQQSSGSTSPCATAGQWGTISYSSTIIPSNTFSALGQSVDSSKEIAC